MCRLAFALLVPLAVSLATACDVLDDEEDVSGLIAVQPVVVALGPTGVADGLLVGETAVAPGTFLAQIRDEMPTVDSVGITRIKLVPGAATGVAAWADVYQGEVLVQLVPEGGQALAVGKVTAPATGLDTLTVTVTTDRGTLDRSPAIAEGRFAVRLQGGTPRAAGDAFDLNVRTEIEYMAF